jgi:hypothetical protein
MIHRLTLASLLVLTGVASAEVAAPPPPAAGSAAAGAPAVERRAPKHDMIDPQADLPPPPKSRVPAPIVASPEIAKLGKQLAGTYKCKGVSLKGDGSSTPLEASYTLKLALDNAWLMGTFTGGGMKFEDYRTFDATAKQWTRIAMHGTSAHIIESTLGEKDGKWTWEGNQIAPTGTTQVRDFEQASGKQIKVWGEALLGGTWQKVYEATCKR